MDGSMSDDIQDGYTPDKKANKIKKPKVPSDFEDEAAFLLQMRKRYDDSSTYFQQNMAEEIEDMEFLAGFHWDDKDYSDRIKDDIPTLTINNFPALISQIVGNRKVNETEIKVIPEGKSSKEVARVREGIIRSIQKNSNSNRAIDKAFEHQLAIGRGEFYLSADWVDYDVFEQELRINQINNPQSVLWDWQSIDVTGKDARYVFMTELMERATFSERYPNAKAVSFVGDGFDVNQNVFGDGWFTSDLVRVVNYWRMRSEIRTVALMSNGDTTDITDISDALFEQLITPDLNGVTAIALDSDGEPMVRQTDRKYAELTVCSGAEILEGPYRMNISRLPVFRCLGWQIDLGERRYTFGILRHLKDPARLKNYLRSAVAEKLMLTAKAPWIASSAAIEGREDEWDNAHLTRSTLTYNAEAGQAPFRPEPIPVEATLLQLAEICSQDIRDISNIHEALLGGSSNEVSGKAISERQRIGLLGTVTYIRNLEEAMKECGAAINEAIPDYYDTTRVIKVLAAGRTEEEPILINSPNDPNSVDVTLGKYSVRAVTGPAYETQRQESREMMMSVLNANPQAMGPMLDLVFEQYDFPGAEQMAIRYRKTLPPSLLGQDEISPEMAERLQAEAEQSQQAAQIASADAEVNIMLKQAQAREAMARALQAEAIAMKAMMEAQIRPEEAAAKIAKAMADVEKMEVDSALNVSREFKGETSGGSN